MEVRALPPEPPSLQRRGTRRVAAVVVPAKRHQARSLRVRWMRRTAASPRGNVAPTIRESIALHCAQRAWGDAPSARGCAARSPREPDSTRRGSVRLLSPRATSWWRDRRLPREVRGEQHAGEATDGHEPAQTEAVDPARATNSRGKTAVRVDAYPVARDCGEPAPSADQRRGAPGLLEMTDEPALAPSGPVHTPAPRGRRTASARVAGWAVLRRVVDHALERTVASADEPAQLEDPHRANKENHEPTEDCRE